MNYDFHFLAAIFVVCDSGIQISLLLPIRNFLHTPAPEMIADLMAKVYRLLGTSFWRFLAIFSLSGFVSV